MTFNSLILYWFDRNKRDLPWRGEINPYKIWLSEVILQQTRVAQGTDYYHRFCERFPDLKSLADASEQEVLKLWQGLGYYSRARNLHFSAKYIQNELKGEFPDNYEDLLKLKGVGEYTAGAIASIAFNEVVPALDGNVYRVMARYFDIHQDISQSKTKKYFWELAKELIDKERPGDYNEAVMELGATICLPVSPKCSVCPLQNSCAALQRNTIHKLPVKSKKIKIKKRIFNFLEITDGERFLFVKRTGKDVWKNLYTFPLVETRPGNSSVSDILKIDKNFVKTSHETHLLTHQRLSINFWYLKTDKIEMIRLSKELKAEFYLGSEIENLPLPRPMEKFMESEI